jgi:2-keto-4-pentenoate hydratase/2-oxohepta-3-ene-1,7-dioic acid hydratase in catechol pathway
VVTSEELGDPENLDIRLLVNDEERQASNTSQMIYSFGEIIESASHSTTINAGDVITTGTPSGVGELSGGDTVRAEIEKIGTMTLDVVQRDVRYEDVVIHREF